MGSAEGWKFAVCFQEYVFDFRRELTECERRSGAEVGCLCFVMCVLVCGIFDCACSRFYGVVSILKVICSGCSFTKGKVMFEFET